MSSIAAGTSAGTALVSTGDTSGTLQLQVNGTTPALTLNTSGAVGVGSSPAYGTSGQVLTSAGSGAAPTWGTVASGMTLVSTVTASSSATITFTGLTAYDVYLVVFNKVVGGGMNLTFSTDNGSTFISTNYRRAYMEQANTSFGSGGGTALSALSLLSSTPDTTASNGGMNGQLFLYKPNAASRFCIYSSMSYLASGALQHVLNNTAGSNDSTTAVNAIRLDPAGGTFASGTFRLYGLANS